MYKYLILLALATAVLAAPPKPEAPKDLDTAQQFFYSTYGYPSVYSGYPTAYSAYSYSGYPYYGAYGLNHALYYGK